MTIVFAIQLGLAGLLALAVGAWASARHADYIPPDGVVEMVLLVHFLDKNFPDLCNARCLDECLSSDGSEVGLPARVSLFRSHYAKYCSEGKLSEEELLPPMERDFEPFMDTTTAVAVGLLVLVVSPFYAFCFWGDTGERENDVPYSVIVHPRERADHSLEIIGCFISVAILAAIGHIFLHGLWRVLITSALSLPAVFCALCFTRLVLNQRTWKGFWSERLRMALQIAAWKNDHDLYNRSLNLYRIVAGQPVLPITRLQVVVLGAFAVVQFFMAPFAN